MSITPSESLRAVRKPWYSWQSLVLSGICVCLVLAWAFMSVPQAYDSIARKIIIGALLVLGVVNQYLRDRAWRRLLAEEAPDLYRKLNDESS